MIRLVLLTLCASNVGLGAKILGVFPVPAPSHRNLYKPLMEELVKKGHHVTIVSPFEEAFPNRSIVLGVNDWMRGMIQKQNFYEVVDTNAFQKIHNSVVALIDLTEMTLADQKVQELIKSQEKFDLLIMTEVLNLAHHALSWHFGAPLIKLSTVGANIWVNSMVGNPGPPSYIPDLFTGYYGNMSFLERVGNTAIFMYMKICYSVYLYPKHDQIIKKYIPGGPSIDQVSQNVSLVLLNSHPSLNQPVPYVPNMIDIGGFHIKPPKKLPPDLQNYLDSAQEGVIYFSMGSNLRSSELPSGKRDAFLKTFSKLKQKVIWKWEEDVLPGQPPNVKLGKWLPQQDILAHPNVKLFITHGGLLSTTETIYHGVPVLAIPIFGDQSLNAKIVVNQGFGLSIAFSDVTEETLTQVIGELLSNPKYTATAKYRSRIFHDRMNAPLDTAIYWIEYVIRNKGAAHLRVAALDLTWYEYLLLDVISFLVLAICLVLYIFHICFRIIFQKICINKDKLKKN